VATGYIFFFFPFLIDFAELTALLTYLYKGGGGDLPFPSLSFSDDDLLLAFSKMLMGKTILSC